MSVNMNFRELPNTLFMSMKAVEAAVKEGGLDEALVELVRYYVSSTQKCAFCIDMHFKEAQAHGVSLNKLYSVNVFDDVDYYSEQEVLALVWARSMISESTKEQRKATFSDLQNYFSKSDIALLSLAITHINSWTQLMKAFAVPAGGYKVGDFS